MKILGLNYELELSKDMDTLNGNMGWCDTNNQIISIASNVQQEAKESTLIHEIIEALDYHLELKLAHNQITSLEAGLHQVLSDAGIDLSSLLKTKKRV